jgi:hypothetical protein
MGRRKVSTQQPCVNQMIMPPMQPPWGGMMMPPNQHQQPPQHQLMYGMGCMGGMGMMQSMLYQQPPHQPGRKRRYAQSDDDDDGEMNDDDSDDMENGSGAITGRDADDEPSNRKRGRGHNKHANTFMSNAVWIGGPITNRAASRTLKSQAIMRNTPELRSWILCQLSSKALDQVFYILTHCALPARLKYLSALGKDKFHKHARLAFLRVGEGPHGLNPDLTNVDEVVAEATWDETWQTEHDSLPKAIPRRATSLLDVQTMQQNTMKVC